MLKSAMTQSLRTSRSPYLRPPGVGPALLMEPCQGRGPSQQPLVQVGGGCDAVVRNGLLHSQRHQTAWCQRQNSVTETDYSQCWFMNQGRKGNREASVF